MCRLVFFGAFVRLLVVVASLALSLFMPNAIVGLAVWPLVWLMWDRVSPENRLNAPSLIELLPFVIAVQVALDCLVPYLGDCVIAIGNAMIVASFRRAKIPRAEVRMSRSPAARACEAARRDS